jgi:chemotaxis methyl-accepting protein methylase
MIKKAKSRTYTEDEVFANKLLTREFVDYTFDIKGEAYIVADNVFNKINFHKGDALDPDIKNTVSKCDVLFAQNLFNNLQPKIARKAFLNIIDLLKEDGFLFVDGMDLGLKVRLTRKKKLAPININIEKNYELAKTYVNPWPEWYSGLEPLSKDKKDWTRRYSAIFKKGTIDDV